MFKNKNLLLVMLLVLTLAVTACGNDEPETDPAPVEDGEDVGEDITEELEEDPVEEIEDAITGENYEDISIMPEEAFDIFAEEYPNVNIKEFKLDKELRKYVYKIEAYVDNDEYEVEIDPFTGDFLDVKSEKDLDDDREYEEITRENIEKVQALVDEALANSEADSLVKEWSVEVDDGIIKLEIEIDQEGFDDIEYTYNLETGQLLELDD